MNDRTTDCANGPLAFARHPRGASNQAGSKSVFVLRFGECGFEDLRGALAARFMRTRTREIVESK